MRPCKKLIENVQLIIMNDVIYTKSQYFLKQKRFKTCFKMVVFDFPISSRFVFNGKQVGKSEV